jgi:hypothetical protein
MPAPVIGCGFLIVDIDESVVNQALERSDEALLRYSFSKGTVPALGTIYGRHHRVALGLAYRILPFRRIG